MSRLDPFSYAFGDLAAERFPDVQRDAAERLADSGDRIAFAALPAVQRLLADVESPELIDARPEAADAYLTALYVAYRFWSAGCRVIPLTQDALEHALRRAAPHELPTVAGGACYFQLAEHWVWARIGADEPYEPLDGFFVVASADGRALTVLAVLGLRPDRGGFSQLSVAATPHEVLMAGQAARTPPFASVLDGGDRAGVRSIVAAGELLHLAQLALVIAGN